MLPIPPWAYGAAAALTFAAGLGTGIKFESWRWSASELHAVKKQDKAAERGRARANNEATNYEHTREANRVDTDRRQAQVRTIYRDKVVPAECEPPADVKRVLDQAIDAANQPAAEPRR